MSLLLMGILFAVVTTALFDFIYYLPRFRALQEEAENKIEKKHL